MEDNENAATGDELLDGFSLEMRGASTTNLTAAAMNAASR
jgi:hypothetical protein